MRQIKLLILFLILSFGAVHAQGMKNQISVQGGYTRFTEVWNKAGFNFGFENQLFLSKRFYLVGSIMSMNNNHVRSELFDEMLVTESGMVKIGDGTINLRENLWETNIGIGAGYDLLQTDKHRIYTHATVGVNLSRGYEDYAGIDFYATPSGTVRFWELKGSWDIKSNGFGAALSLGYEYKLTDRFALGVSYNGIFTSGLDFYNSFNAKLGYSFTIH